MPFDAVFNAKEVEPKQGGSKHAVGNKWQGSITGTRVDPTKDQKGGMFIVTFTSPGGSIDNRYNLWNESTQAVKIAKEQLSALCHATGIFQIDFKNDGAALRGARLLYDIGFQAGQEPTAEKPEGGYVEVKKVYDLNGNDSWGSGAAPSQQQQTSGFNQQQQQPNVNQQQQTNNAAANNGNWNSGGPAQNQVQSGWNAGNQQQQQPNNQQQQNNAGGWQQGNEQQKPPWNN